MRLNERQRKRTSEMAKSTWGNHSRGYSFSLFVVGGNIRVPWARCLWHTNVSLELDNSHEFQVNLLVPIPIYRGLSKKVLEYTPLHP
jgi:hypothetical protein